MVFISPDHKGRPTISGGEATLGGVWLTSHEKFIHFFPKFSYVRRIQQKSLKAPSRHFPTFFLQSWNIILTYKPK